MRLQLSANRQRNGRAADAARGLPSAAAGYALTEQQQLYAALGQAYGLRFISLIANVLACSESAARKTTQKLIPGLLAAACCNSLCPAADSLSLSLFRLAAMLRGRALRLGN